MVTRRSDYTIDAVEAARSVLLELFHLLGEYQKSIVVVGGWVPVLLINDAPREHVGSLDVDIALNHLSLDEIGYRTISQLLLDHGYRQSDQPFIFFRSVNVRGKSYNVEVDFLAGEYSGTGRSHRTQIAQDMHPRKARGCDLAINLAVEITMSGVLPDGGLDTTTLRVASIVSFFVMKAMALAGRLAEKDSYDIYYCVRHFPGGMEKLVYEFKPHLNNGLVKEALKIVSEKFASPDHIGPKHVADFEDINDPSERALIQRDAYERINTLISRLTEF